jgi:hypothetical protein
MQAPPWVVVVRDVPRGSAPASSRADALQRRGEIDAAAAAFPATVPARGGRTRVLLAHDPFAAVDALNGSGAASVRLAAAAGPCAHPRQAERMATLFDGTGRALHQRLARCCEIAASSGCAFYVDPT